MAREILETKRKALKINLDAAIYGTFAEIGAGQEVARNFFTAGAASGTVAKTMSAYDMVFSNSIYGEEESGRYVSKSRLSKMLSHEFELLSERLTGTQYTGALFAFADTVTTLNFSKTNDPHGWLGIRFQIKPGGEYNDVIFHVRLLDSDSGLQQNVLGILGVNLVYAAYYHNNDVQTMIESLVDNLTAGSVEIDLISVSGHIFGDVNDRLVNLYLIAKGFSGAAIFDKEANARQAKDMLYKKDIMILRTRYKQKSNPNFDLFNKAVEQFKRSQSIDENNLIVLIEVLMNNMLDEDEKELNKQDLEELAKRAEDLCATGNYVIVSDFTRNNKLAQYLARCKPSSVGISTNIANLKRVFDANSFTGNYTDELLAYISDLFSKNVKLYAYPYLDKKGNQIITTQNMPVSEQAKPLFDFLIRNHYIADIEDYDTKMLKLFDAA